MWGAVALQGKGPSVSQAELGKCWVPGYRQCYSRLGLTPVVEGHVRLHSSRDDGIDQGAVEVQALLIHLNPRHVLGTSSGVPASNAANTRQGAGLTVMDPVGRMRLHEIENLNIFMPRACRVAD